MTLVNSTKQCKNCESELKNDASYCTICGAKVIVEPFTFKYIRDDFSEQFLNIDNNILIRTLRDMIFRPEEVIQGYIDGVRRRHLKLANFMALALTLSGLLIFIIQKFIPEAMDVSFMIQDDNPMKENFDSESFGNFMEYQGIMFLLFIPVYALMSKLSFYNQKQFSYLKHIVFVAYTQAFLSVIMFIPTLLIVIAGYNYIALSYWVILIMFLYNSYCYKRLFKLSFGKLLLRILVFFGVLIVAFIIYIFIIIGVMMANGQMQQVIEAERAKQLGYIVSSARNWTS